MRFRLGAALPPVFGAFATLAHAIARPAPGAPASAAPPAHAHSAGALWLGALAVLLSALVVVRSRRRGGGS